MEGNRFDTERPEIAWCPGCGNFGILSALKMALDGVGVDPHNLVIVSGIGQAAKTPHYLKCNVFHGLHGRAVPVATGVKAANPELVVIAEGGDGDMYGEGGNHFLHAIRRNPNITNIAHNNMVYGLTKGQASPTTFPGFKTPVQIDGVTSGPLNPLAVAIALDASFVARVFADDIEQTAEVLREAITHRGYSLVDVFQPCTSFNRTYPREWFKDNTYYLDETHDPRDRLRAFERAIQEDRLPLGIFYVNERRTPFEESLSAYAEDRTPVCRRKRSTDRLSTLLEELRR
jgi:2-oxoglutarate ferredoxin oxidoreductase subunit beta